MLPNNFDAKIDKLPGGCWIWTGSKTSRGYGNAYIAGQYVLMHRAAYEHYIGPIPEGYNVTHTCRNQLCLQPKHLKAVTPREKTLQYNGPTTINARKTHCKRGHEFTPENTHVTPLGSRICRICRKQHAHNAYLRKKAARRAARG